KSPCQWTGGCVVRDRIRCMRGNQETNSSSLPSEKESPGHGPGRTHADEPIPCVATRHLIGQAGENPSAGRGPRTPDGDRTCIHVDLIRGQSHQNAVALFVGPLTPSREGRRMLRTSPGPTGGDGCLPRISGNSLHPTSPTLPPPASNAPAATTCSTSSS